MSLISVAAYRPVMPRWARTARREPRHLPSRREFPGPGPGHSCRFRPVRTFCTKFKTARQAGRTRRDQGADNGRSAGAPRPSPPYRGPPPARIPIPKSAVPRCARTRPPAGSLAPVRAGPSTADQASRADQPAPPQTFIAPLRLARVMRRHRPARSPEGGRRRTGLRQQGDVKRRLTSRVPAGDRTVEGRRTSGDA